jgi:hypothetical protein
MRKHTKFSYCEEHAEWFTTETRNRQAECFVEGGPAYARACKGGTCEMRPGTDYFVPDFVVKHADGASPAAMGWNNA